MDEPRRLYLRDHTRAVPLTIQPVLASWDARGSKNQARLHTFLGHVTQALGFRLDDGQTDLCLSLEIGLPTGTSLTSHGHDLDNYLFPLAEHVGAGRLTAVFGRKSHSDRSSLCVSRAVSVTELVARPILHVRTTASSQNPGWKAQINAACRDQAAGVLPDGGVSLQLLIVTSRSRNWATLWKPAIDALGPLLGVDDPSRPYTPRDDRIVDLGLHHAVDDSLRHDVELFSWWRGVP